MPTTVVMVVNYRTSGMIVIIGDTFTRVVVVVFCIEPDMYRYMRRADYRTDWVAEPIYIAPQ